MSMDYCRQPAPYLNAEDAAARAGQALAQEAAAGCEAVSGAFSALQDSMEEVDTFLAEQSVRAEEVRSHADAPAVLASVARVLTEAKLALDLALAEARLAVD